MQMCMDKKCNVKETKTCSGESRISNSKRCLPPNWSTNLIFYLVPFPKNLHQNEDNWTRSGGTRITTNLSTDRMPLLAKIVSQSLTSYHQQRTMNANLISKIFASDVKCHTVDSLFEWIIYQFSDPIWSCLHFLHICR